MAFQSLRVGSHLGRAGRDELQKLNTKCLTQMRSSPGGPSLPPVSPSFAEAFGVIPRSLVLGTSTLMRGAPGFSPTAGWGEVSVLYQGAADPNRAGVLSPVSSVTSSSLQAEGEGRCHSRFMFSFLHLLSPKGSKAVAELPTSGDLAPSSTLLQPRPLLPGCPGAGSNTCHHMQYGHNTLIPTGSRTQQKKAQAEDQTWKEQKTEELLPFVSGTEK